MESGEIVREILDILDDRNSDWKAIVVGLAKRNPELLIEINSKIPPLKFPDLRNICEVQGKIPAIKYIRESEGWGLKEAKEFVEEYAINNGIVFRGGIR